MGAVVGRNHNWGTAALFRNDWELGRQLLQRGDDDLMRGHMAWVTGDPSALRWTETSPLDTSKMA